MLRKAASYFLEPQSLKFSFPSFEKHRTNELESANYANATLVLIWNVLRRLALFQLIYSLDGSPIKRAKQKGTVGTQFVSFWVLESIFAIFCTSLCQQSDHENP